MYDDELRTATTNNCAAFVFFQIQVVPVISPPHLINLCRLYSARARMRGLLEIAVQEKKTENGWNQNERLKRKTNERERGELTKGRKER